MCQILVSEGKGGMLDRRGLNKDCLSSSGFLLNDLKDLGRNSVKYGSVFYLYLISSMQLMRQAGWVVEGDTELRDVESLPKHQLAFASVDPWSNLKRAALIYNKLAEITTSIPNSSVPEYHLFHSSLLGWSLSPLPLNFIRSCTLNFL